MPRLVEGRGWWPSEMPKAPPLRLLRSSPEAVHGVAFFKSFTNFESLLHLVRGGSVGM